MHTTVARGKNFDYFLSSTPPLEVKFYFLYAPSTCKIKIAFYTKRSNRVDIHQDDVFMPANNARVGADNAIEWQKPDNSYVPTVDSHDAESNFQQRDHQRVVKSPFSILTNVEQISAQTAAIPPMLKIEERQKSSVKVFGMPVGC